MKPVTCVLLSLAATFAAQSAPPSHQGHVFDASVPHRVHVSYLLFLPASYAIKRQSQWPLILYLHGGSLRGDDVERLKTLGLPHKLESEPDFPFVVVSPQCPSGEIWTDAEAVDALLERITHDYRIDPDRIYVTGHSMGGRGALYFAYRLPSRFAAVIAVSPLSPINEWARTLAHVPLWLFHGTADTLAPVADTNDLVQSIKAAGGHPRFDSLPGRDHFILDVYERPNIYEWLLQQKRSKHADSSSRNAVNFSSTRPTKLRLQPYDVIRVYDEAGNVIETHEHAGDFKEPRNVACQPAAFSGIFPLSRQK
jgi:acetyl esterase/lipase